MPEYSSTTITPSDGVQVPGMNGSTSGNFLLSALKSYILSEKGLANGLASLDANGKLLSSQLPDLADDVIVVASYASLPATGTAGKIYITADNNKMYRWDPDLETPNYVVLSIDLTEYARIVDIQDGNIQAGVAVKAFQDAMGRAIITTYETKADASDLKDAIDFNRKRIENLEQKSGSVVDVDYPEYSVYGEVPTGKAKNAIVSKLRGVSVAWNELAPSLKTGYSRFNLSETSKPNSTLFTVTRSGLGELYTSINFTAGHKVLVLFNVLEKSSNTISFRVRRPFISGFNSSSELIGNIGIVSDSSDKNTLALQCDNTREDDTFELDDAIISYDLTQMFGSQVADYLYSIEQATTGAGVALFRALVSAQDNSHETGRLVSTTYEAVKSKKDFFDQQMELGMYNDTTGAKEASNNRLRSVNRQPCTPNTTYYFDSPTNAYGYGYDANGNYLGSYFNMTANSNFTTPNNCHSFAFYVTTQYGTTYGNDIHVIGVLDTLTLPESVTLRGILKVDNNNLVVNGDEYDPETGEIERNYGEYTFTAQDTWTTSTTSEEGIVRMMFTGLAGILIGASASEVAPIVSAEYEAKSLNATYGKTKGISANNAGNIQIYDPDYDTSSDVSAFASYMAGKKICYKLATPTSDPNPVTPINDPTLATEGGGTLSTTQTNDPAIVSAMQISYLTL